MPGTFEMYSVTLSGKFFDSKLILSMQKVPDKNLWRLKNANFLHNKSVGNVASCCFGGPNNFNNLAAF